MNFDSTFRVETEKQKYNRVLLLIFDWKKLYFFWLIFFVSNVFDCILFFWLLLVCFPTISITALPPPPPLPHFHHQNCLSSLIQWFFFEFKHTQSRITLRRGREEEKPPTLLFGGISLFKGQLLVAKQGCVGVRNPIRESGTRDIPDFSPVRFRNPGFYFHLENCYFWPKKPNFSIFDNKKHCSEDVKLELINYWLSYILNFKNLPKLCQFFQFFVKISDFITPI